MPRGGHHQPVSGTCSIAGRNLTGTEVDTAHNRPVTVCHLHNGGVGDRARIGRAGCRGGCSVEQHKVSTTVSLTLSEGASLACSSASAGSACYCHTAGFPCDLKCSLIPPLRGWHDHSFQIFLQRRRAQTGDVSSDCGDPQPAIWCRPRAAAETGAARASTISIGDLIAAPASGGLVR